jgi:hypothetical protein
VEGKSGRPLRAFSLTMGRLKSIEALILILRGLLRFEIRSASTTELAVLAFCIRMYYQLRNSRVWRAGHWRFMECSRYAMDKRNSDSCQQFKSWIII